MIVSRLEDKSKLSCALLPNADYAKYKLLSLKSVPKLFASLQHQWTRKLRWTIFVKNVNIIFSPSEFTFFFFKYYIHVQYSVTHANHIYWTKQKQNKYHRKKNAEQNKKIIKTMILDWHTYKFGLVIKKCT